MSPEVVAAIIAASVSLLTLIGTLIAQYLGRRATSRDTQGTLEQQRKQLDRTLAQQGEHLDRTLAEQREQLDRTLAEQREQLDRTLAEQRTRTLNERFATAAEQLGSDEASVRLAGVYAMAGLADDWEENRQTCVDVLCAYLRLPYEPDPGHDAPQPQRLAFQAIREVRHTVIRVITAHLKKDAAASWQGLNFDFAGVVFDGGDFSGAVFSGDNVSFAQSEFSAGELGFIFAEFSGRSVSFGEAKFSGGEVSFIGAEFNGDMINFSGAEFSSGTVSFMGAQFSDGMTWFDNAKFSGGFVQFFGANFSGAAVSFRACEFSGSRVEFGGPEQPFAMSPIKPDPSGRQAILVTPSLWSRPPRFDWEDTPPTGVSFNNVELSSIQDQTDRGRLTTVRRPRVSDEMGNHF